MKNAKKEYDITIRATITKTVRAEGVDQESATHLAHSLFSCDADDAEDYEQDTMSVSEVLAKKTRPKP